MTSWLEWVLDETKEFESPASFFFWSTLSAISAVVKDNVWIQLKRSQQMHPNLYVILYAPSAMRKGMPITFAKKLVREADNTRVIVGRSSVQAILQDLSVPSYNDEDEDDDLGNRDSCGFVCASEFSSSLVDDSQAIKTLTDIYDRNYNEGEWKIRLKSGYQTLRNPCITILGGANDEQFRDILSQRDVKGGFLGRTCLIAAERPKTLNPLLGEDEDEVDSLDTSDFVSHLKRLAQLRGKFKVSTGARKYYRDWYMQFYTENLDFKDDTGSFRRVGDKILKVSMLLSLAENAAMEIDAWHMERAVQLVFPTLRAAINVSQKAGSVEDMSEKAVILGELVNAENHMMTRKKLMGRNWMHLSAVKMDMAISDLKDAGYVLAKHKGEEVVVSLTKRAIRELIEEAQSDAVT